MSKNVVTVGDLRRAIAHMKDEDAVLIIEAYTEPGEHEEVEAGEVVTGDWEKGRFGFTFNPRTGEGTNAVLIR